MSGSSFTQTIALEGGKEVARQLADIGKAGKQAFDDIGAATKSASQNLNSAQSVFGQLASAFQSMVGQIAGAGEALGKTFDPLISAAGKGIEAASRTGAGFAAIAGAAAGISGAIGKIGQEAANSVAKLNDAATAAGLTKEKYSALRAAFEGVGVGGDVLDKMVAASDKAARQAEVKGGRRGWIHVPGAPKAAAEGEDDPNTHTPSSDSAENRRKMLADGWKEFKLPEIGGALSKDSGDIPDIAAKADGEKTSVLGAEREISNLPKVHAGSGGKTQGLGGYAQAAAELGVALRDMYGKARPGIEIARDVVLSLGKMADGARRSDIAVRAFGEGLAKEVLAVADNREAINALAEAHERSAANMSEAQKKQAEDARATGAILASVKASWLEYFRSLATPVTIDQNNAIITFFERNKAALKDFGDSVIGPAIRWLGQFQNAFGATALAAGALGSSLGLLSPLAATAFGAAGVAAIVFGDQITSGAVAAMNELTRIVKANDLSTFAGWKNAAIAIWEDIKQIAIDAWTNIRQRVASVDWASAWSDFKATALAAWESLREQVAAIDWASIWNSLKSTAIAVFDELVAIATSAWAQISEAFASVDLSGLWTAFVDRAGEAFARMAEIARNGYAALRTAALSAFPGLTGAWEEMERIASAVFDAIKQMSLGTWIAIGIGLVGLTGLFRGTFSEILLLAAPFWRQLLAGAEMLFPGLRAALAPLTAVASQTFAGIETVAGAAWAYLRALFSGDKALQMQAWGTLAESAATTWAKITEVFATGYAAIRAQMTGAFAWMRGPWEELEGAVARAWAAIKAEHEAGYPTIKGVWDNLVATWQGVKAAADLVAGAINLIFRTNYSGTQLLLIAVFLQVIGLAPVITALIMGLVVSIELFTAVVGAIPAVIAVVGASFTGLAALARGLAAAFMLISATPWGAVVIAVIAAVGIALYALYTHWDQVKAGAQAAWAAIASGTSNALASIRGAAEAFFGWLEAKWNALKDLGGALWDRFRDGAISAWDGVKTAFTDSVAWIEDKWNALIEKIKSGFASVKSLFGGGASSSGASDQSSGASGSGSSSNTEIGAHASGGLIAGPGSGTSDSILARLSNGEFVVSARAVGAFGADFFHSLNNLQMPGFAMGGMIGTPAIASLPAFASGGVARPPAHAGLIPFTLDQGGRLFELMAPRDTVRDLQRHSAQSQMASTTKRKPSWDR